MDNTRVVWMKYTTRTRMWMLFFGPTRWNNKKNKWLCTNCLTSGFQSAFLAFKGRQKLAKMQHLESQVKKCRMIYYMLIYHKCLYMLELLYSSPIPPSWLNHSDLLNTASKPYWPREHVHCKVWSKVWSLSVQAPFSLRMILPRIQLLKYKKFECLAGHWGTHFWGWNAWNLLPQSQHCVKWTVLYAEVYLKTSIQHQKRVFLKEHKKMKRRDLEHRSRLSDLEKLQKLALKEAIASLCILADFWKK